MRHALLHVSLLSLAPVLIAGCARQAYVPPAMAASPITRTATIDSSAIETQGDRPLADIIASRVPGVRVVRAADGSLSLSLRGEGSFYSDGQPLVVIDGLEVDPMASGGLSMVNPHDIATVKVLKDPASLSLYGVRGSNGVIVITTKHSRP